MFRMDTSKYDTIYIAIYRRMVGALMYKVIQQTIRICTFCMVMFISVNISYAATKEQAKRILKLNRDAITVNLQILEDYPADTRWFFLLNSRGFISIMPMTEVSHKSYQQLYKAEMMVLYAEKEEKKNAVDTTVNR